MKKHIVLISLCIIALFMIIACTAGPNISTKIPSVNGDVAGFFMGLWHGFISLFTFIISLFTDKVSIYEVHNSGGWYDFGFILGIMTFFGSGGHASGRRR
jgi:hypothetical protein